MSAGTHYDVLGVPRDSSSTVIRDAYRRRARVHHPDRQRPARAGDAPPQPDEMAAINEAYRVLSDPARRVVYDATLRTTGSAAPPSASRGSTSDDGGSAAWSAESERWAGTRPGAVHPSHLGPARVPWRMLLFAGALAAVGVVALSQFTEPSEPPGPDGILRVGSCVSIEPNGDAREVNCTLDGVGDLVVEAFIPFDATCPGGTEPHRDRQGMGVACTTPSE